MAQRGPRPFINTTPLKQPDRAARKNARSYAMHGKNSGKRRNRLVKKPCLDSWINRQLATGLCHDPEPSSHKLACPNQFPRQIASAWTLFQFAEEPGPYMRQKLYKCKFSRQAPLWFDHLGQSQTYVHNQLFVAMAYFDMIIDRAGHVSPVTISHMTKSLGLLQTDLGADDRATAEVTIATIIAFAMVAFVSGDTDSAKKHLHGLFKVLAMRGGLGSLRTCTYLQTKCCRLDLSYAMCTCSKPLFFAADNISWNSYLPRCRTAPPITAIHLLISDSDPDPRMVNLEPFLLQEVMISVQYRLLNLQYDNADVHELLRVVMLAYSTTILPLLFSQFAMVWLLVIIRISVLDNTVIDLPLCQTIQALQLSSWDEMLFILKGFLWVDMLHGQETKKLLSNTAIWTERAMKF
ncbi:hypothetical protein V8E51_001483 [Hyaloscypha variabilis]